MSNHQHRSLKQELLARALKDIADKGVEEFSLRELAKELHVSHASPYRHFASKESLVKELTIQGYENLKAFMEHVIEKIEDPEQQLYELAFTYINFFVENRAYFSLMYEHPILDEVINEEIMPHREQAYKILTGIIQNNMTKGTLRQGNVEEFAFMMWAYLHGVVLLWHRHPKQRHVSFSHEKILHYMKLFMQGFR